MIEVLEGGFFTSLQDSGRPGYRHLGVPASGAADILSFALANYTIGNPWTAPALEVTLGGLILHFRQKTQLALGGADMEAELDGQSLKPYQPITIKTGARLSFGHARHGCRAYVAVAGGLAGRAFLGSVSTYSPGRIGGLENSAQSHRMCGRALQAGDIIHLAGLDPMPLPPPVLSPWRPKFSNHVVLRTLFGPESASLTVTARRLCFTRVFTASVQMDRMGCRLQGPALTQKPAPPMVSTPLLPGTVQLPEDGQPVVSLVDSHCTGGYRRILQVIRADLWLLGQIAPHTRISFRRCLPDQALQIWFRRNSLYGSHLAGFCF